MHIIIIIHWFGEIRHCRVSKSFKRDAIAPPLLPLLVTPPIIFNLVLQQDINTHTHIYINNIYSYTSVSTRGTHSLRTAHRSLQVSAPTFTFPHLSLAHSRTRPPHPARYVFTSGKYYTSQYYLTTIPRNPHNGKLGRINNPRCIHMIV